MRDEKFERIHYVQQILADAYPKALTWKELAERVAERTLEEVPCKRTMLRDVENLKRQGFEIHEEMVDRKTVVSLAPQDKSDKLPISDIQLLGLSIAQEMMQPLRGTVFWNGIRALWNETIRQATEATQQHFNRRRQQVIVRGMPKKSYSDKGGLLSTIFDALLNRREVEILYCKQGIESQAKTRLFRPYTLAFYHGSIYVVGEDASREDFRMLKLDRISRAARTDRFFKVRSDFNADDYFSDSLSVYNRRNEKTRRITLRVDQSVAAHIAEQPWHPDQKLTQTSDGNYTLILPAAYESEVIAKVLSYQSLVEILAPKSTREKMRKTLRGMLEKYK